MPPVRRQLVVDGLRLSYLEQGTPSAASPSLVVLHGLMGSADTFREFLAELPAHQHVIALDLPGAGGSERRRGMNATLAAMAHATVRVMEDLGIKRPVLFGHSHGGAIAMTVAQTVPEQISSLILCAPAHPYFREDRPLIRFYLSLPGRLFAYTIPWFPRWMQMLGLRRMAGPQSWDTSERLRPYRENLQTPGTMHHLLTLLRTWSEDMANLHRQLKVPVEHPTLILWGDQDRAVPLHSAAELRQRFKLSEMHVFPGVGHRPAEECAQPVAREVSEFMARIERWGWRYSPKLAEIHAESAPLMTPSFVSGD
jgi:pimeloyl-ACP methyl ester carboxylesterase